MRCFHQWQNWQQCFRICERHDLERTPASTSFIPKRWNLGRMTPCRYQPGKDHAYWRDGPSNESSWFSLRTTFYSGCTSVSPSMPRDCFLSTHGCAPREIPHMHAYVCGPRLCDQHSPNWPPQHWHQIWHHCWCTLHLFISGFIARLPIFTIDLWASCPEHSQASVWTPQSIRTFGLQSLQEPSHQGAAACCINHWWWIGTGN